MDSRHRDISCPDVFFFFLSLLIFARSGADFTVTFSDSYVSHMWAGVSAVIRPAVLFSPESSPNSATVVSGQISSHVIAVFLF